MSSILSFLRKRFGSADTPREASSPRGRVGAQPMASRTRSPLPAAVSPLLNSVMTHVLHLLEHYLPPTNPFLPPPGVFTVEAWERPVGIGNRVGSQRLGAFGALERKGLRLEARVRFELWDDRPHKVEQAMAELHTRLMTDGDALWAQGFLHLSLEEAALVEYLRSLDAWRKAADYRLLFEHRYEDADGAQSLIARIPIESDLEIRKSPQRETSQVTDEMARWDNEEAAPLAIRGPISIGGLSALHFVPGPSPTGTVLLKRTFEGAAGPATTYATLDSFLAALAGAGGGERHGQVVFSSLNDFLGAFSAAGDPVALGDWDVNMAPDLYQSGVLTLFPAIRLPRPTDLLEISHQHSALNEVAVIYLKAMREY